MCGCGCGWMGGWAGGDGGRGRGGEGGGGVRRRGDSSTARDRVNEIRDKGVKRFPGSSRRAGWQREADSTGRRNKQSGLQPREQYLFVTDISPSPCAPLDRSALRSLARSHARVTTKEYRRILNDPANPLAMHRRYHTPGKKPKITSRQRRILHIIFSKQVGHMQRKLQGFTRVGSLLAVRVGSGHFSRFGSGQGDPTRPNP